MLHTAQFPARSASRGTVSRRRVDKKLSAMFEAAFPIMTLWLSVIRDDASPTSSRSRRPHRGPAVGPISSQIEMVFYVVFQKKDRNCLKPIIFSQKNER